MLASILSCFYAEGMQSTVSKHCTPPHVSVIATDRLPGMELNEEVVEPVRLTSDGGSTTLVVMMLLAVVHLWLVS